MRLILGIWVCKFHHGQAAVLFAKDQIANGRWVDLIFGAQGVSLILHCSSVIKGKAARLSQAAI